MNSEAAKSQPRTMFEKIWDAHVVHAEPGKQTILYIDLHLVHEVTSPQAFEGLRLAGRKVRRPRAHRGHARPQRADDRPAAADRRSDLEAANRHAADELPGVWHPAVRSRQSAAGNRARHRSGAGADAAGHDDRLRRQSYGHAWRLWALAFGIGTSEVEHVLATQTLLQSKPKTFELRVDGRLAPGVTAKDLILYLIGQITTDGGTGYVIEYTGEAIRALSQEERMTVCNMSIEAVPEPA